VLIHPWDTATDDEALDVVRRLGFGHLIAPGSDRDLPVVVPTQYVVADAEPLRVLLHLARPNPVFRALAERPRCLLAVAGDWAYVPSNWKAIGDEDPLIGIPTTYYAAVQLEADVEVVDDPVRLSEILRTQLGDVQPGTPVSDPEVAHARQLSGIRGLVLTVTTLRGKLKYGGNVDAAHRTAVAERLEQRGGPGDSAARAHLLRRLDAES
jgi:transcriptional regulator